VIGGAPPGPDLDAGTGSPAAGRRGPRSASPPYRPLRQHRPPRVARPPQRGWARFSTRRWANIILVASAVVFVLAGVVGGYALQISSTVTDRLVDRITPSYLEAQNLQAALLDQEAAVRSYLLTADPAALQPYQTGRAAESAETARLRTLLTDPALVADLDRSGQLAARWRRVFAAPAIAEVGRSGPVPDQVVSQRGKDVFDELRSVLGGLQRHLADTRSRTRAEVADLERWRDVIFLVILGAFLLTGALLSLWLRRAIIRPLRDLGSTTRRVANEDFGQQIAVRGPTDVVELGADVESLRLRVVTELANAVEAHRLLEAQAEELRRSNAELEQFAYVASHDLQEPLRKVSSFCQLLERRYGDQLDERARQYIRFAVDAAKRMQVLINDLLSFSRVGRFNDGTGRNDRWGPVVLAEALGEALGNLSTRLEENDAEVTTGPLPTVPGDRTLLTMLLQNLVGNAVKFRSADRPPVIAVSAERDGEMWRLAVQDNGIGVDPQFSDKIFVIFQRLHTREEYSGTGIGLALCKKIVEFHGGRIWLDAGYRDGARIVFTVPAPVEGGTIEDGAAADGASEDGVPEEGAAGESRPDPQGATAP
jgi:signal transduction histidine kinase